MAKKKRKETKKPDIVIDTGWFKIYDPEKVPRTVYVDLYRHGELIRVCPTENLLDQFYAPAGDVDKIVNGVLRALGINAFAAFYSDTDEDD